MNRKGLITIAVLIAAGGLWLTLNNAEAQTETSGVDQADAMAAWMELAQPGPEHKNLNYMIGTWTTKSTMWMAGPEGPPVTDEGTAECTWMLGGRYVRMDYKSSMMGMEFEGIGINGYDRVRNVYTNTWMDNMSTGIYNSTGSYDPKKKIFTLFGKMDDPGTKTYGYMVKSRTTILGPDSFKFEMFNPHKGENAKLIKIVYTRKK